MKKLLITGMLALGIVGFSEQRITIKNGSYCEGLMVETLGMSAEYGLDFVDYGFKKCVINGKTYTGSFLDEDNVILEEMIKTNLYVTIYYNSTNWKTLENGTRNIKRKDRINFKGGETMVIEQERRTNQDGTPGPYVNHFSINVKKTSIFSK